MYADNSFFTLSTGGSVGLICLSLVLALMVFGVGKVLMRRRNLTLRLTIAAVLFAVFVWLSPQVYYAYYQFLIDGLPQQWVIVWPRLNDLIGAITFTGRATLSAHGQGLLFWGLVILAVKGRGLRR